MCDIYSNSITNTRLWGSTILHFDGTSVGKPITIFDGQATYGTPLLVGSHQIDASYLGAPDFMTSISDTLTVIVSPLSNA